MFAFIVCLHPISHIAFLEVVGEIHFSRDSNFYIVHCTDIAPIFFDEVLWDALTFLLFWG
jgi:hypothetical protein